MCIISIFIHLQIRLHTVNLIFIFLSLFYSGKIHSRKGNLVLCVNFIFYYIGYYKSYELNVFLVPASRSESMNFSDSNPKQQVLFLKIAKVERDQSQSICGLEERVMDFQVVLYRRILQL